ncbi:MAG: hypothetical protein M1820_005606 [Bogoriella megaspora]|nr:MAG: hypothetical protein M1820_005606 [Bogoriella megaspora]
MSEENKQQRGVGGILGGVADTAGKGLSGVTKTLGNTVEGAGNTLGSATKGTGETLSGVTKGVGDTTKSLSYEYSGFNSHRPLSIPHPINHDRFDVSILYTYEQSHLRAALSTAFFYEYASPHAKYTT